MNDLPRVKPQKDDHERGEVYFLECGDFIKIGFSIQSHRRLRCLQASIPMGTRVLCKTYCHKILERRLHKKFAHLRANGEWFRKAPELFAMIEVFR